MFIGQLVPFMVGRPIPDNCFVMDGNPAISKNDFPDLYAYSDPAWGTGATEDCFALFNMDGYTENVRWAICHTAN